jgi:hypothetical protein
MTKAEGSVARSSPTVCPLCKGTRRRFVTVFCAYYARSSGPTPTTATYKLRVRTERIVVPCECVEGWPTLVLKKPKET